MAMSTMRGEGLPGKKLLVTSKYFCKSEKKSNCCNAEKLPAPPPPHLWDPATSGTVLLTQGRSWVPTRAGHFGHTMSFGAGTCKLSMKPI